MATAAATTTKKIITYSERTACPLLFMPNSKVKSHAIRQAVGHVKHAPGRRIKHAVQALLKRALIAYCKQDNNPDDRRDEQNIFHCALTFMCAHALVLFYFV